VVHVARAYGVPSQPFVQDTIREVERCGWRGYLVTRRMDERWGFSFPPDERLIIARRPSISRRIVGRVAMRGAAERRAEWITPHVLRLRPHLIHAHFGWAAVESVSSSRRLGVPLLATFHGTDLTVTPTQRAWTRPYARLLSQLERATVVSTFLERRLRDLGFEGRVDVIPMGLRLEEFPPRPAPAHAGGNRLIYVGRLVPRKGLDVLIRAFAIVRREVPDVTLEAIGDGPEASANRVLAERLGVDAAVTFHGPQPRTAVAAALGSATIAVVPSRTMPDGEAEGLGLAAVEAQAIGVPLVATDCGGLPEAVAPEFRNDLAREGDPDSLAARILAMLEHRDEWPERVAVSRAWAERFAWDRIARRFSNVYSELLR
jgi:colanic acid/amylovoran biosynthesis glycosyltransferase